MKQYMLAVHMDRGRPRRRPTIRWHRCTRTWTSSTPSCRQQERGCSLEDSTSTSATGRADSRRRGRNNRCPFAETKEQLGGLWIIEATDLDAALEWAAQGSAALAAQRSRSVRSRSCPTR